MDKGLFFLILIVCYDVFVVEMNISNIIDKFLVLFFLYFYNLLVYLVRKINLEVFLFDLILILFLYGIEMWKLEVVKL